MNVAQLAKVFNSSKPPPIPEALLSWYLLSLANEQLEEKEKLCVSKGLKKKAREELGEQEDLSIDTAKKRLSEYYSVT